MRILHIGKYYDPFRGGIENFCLDLCRAQAAAGHQVAMLAHDEALRGRTRREIRDGVRVVKAANLGTVAYAPMAPTFGLVLSRLLRSFAPDVIHLHMPNLSAAWLAVIRPRAPLVIHWHSDVVPSEIDAKVKFFHRFYKPIEGRALTLAKAVIATSRDYLDSSAPLSSFRNKCRVIPLGLDTCRLAAPGGPPRCLPNADGQPTLLAVGRFTYYKGFEHLIRAVADSPGMRLVLAGSGPLFADLRALAGKLGASERIIMPGSVDDAELMALYRACHVFCLPSVERTEAFGLVLLEAMSQGLPLVTTRVPGSGMNAVNEHGVTGLCVPPADPGSLALALTALAGDKALRQQMAEACRKRFSERFDIGPVARNIEKLYASIS